MQIRSIKVFVYKDDQHYRLSGTSATPGLIPGTDYFRPPAWRQSYSRKVESCLIKITTDNGVTGWGEAQSPLLPETTASIIRHLLGPFLIGQNPLERSRIADDAYHLNNIRGHGTGFMVDAISGIDLALWDIAGKHYGASVCELLGGPFRRRLPAYVSGLRQPTIEEQCSAARRFIDEGFAGIKLFLGYGVAEDIKAIRSVRNAVPEAHLYCDLLWRYNVGDAILVARALEGEGYEWLEAPIAHENLDGYRKLVQSVDIPIASGEALRTPYEFQTWFENGAIEVAQPDVGRTGLSSGVKVASLAEARSIQVAPHVGVCSGIAMAATWQFAAAIPNFSVQENQLEILRRTNRILDPPLVVENGELLVPDAPGLGVAVDENMVLESSSDHFEV
ncbi:MAG: mandelate racemase/muconate lactonizing enzyme family protein [Albidovulum sp.]|nr:mandelate racemase/muconate lactonizing enzyme family protein [Albidovulum sp.]